MKRYLVTGSSRGIGNAVLNRLADDGHEIIPASRSDVGIDVTSDELEDWLDSIGLVDGIITCAGAATVPARFDDIPAGVWRRSMDLNFQHHVRVLRWWLRLRHPGAAVLVSSTAGMRPSPTWTPYAAAKAALINVALSVAAEQAGTGRRIYVVAPGRCATDLRRVLAPEEDPSTIMQPTEVADVIATLLADTTGVLSGQVIEVARRLP